MHRPILVLGVILSGLPLAACRVSVDSQKGTGKANVDISTPLGDVKVRTDIDPPNTGLPVYPGARPLASRRHPDSADVDVGNQFFGVKVIAARFTMDCTEQPICSTFTGFCMPMSTGPMTSAPPTLASIW